MNKLILEPILALDMLERMVTPKEWSRAAEFASTKRRQEWLSWRAYLRRYLAEEGFSDFEIEYNELGAPQVVGSELSISVSHTSTHVAILISDTPCAIDMELRNRNFAKVAARYISPEESAIVATPELQAVAWCTKEAAYKYGATRGCDLLRDIKIVGVGAEKVDVELLGKRVIANYIVSPEWVVVTIL